MRTLLDATALDDVSEACHHWHNFALKSGDDQWRRQDLVSGGRDDRGAEGAEWGGVWGWVSAPQPTRGSGGAS